MKKIDEFDAFDSTNKKYRIVHYKSVKNVSDLSNQNAAKQGMSEYRLGTGERINRISDTEFELPMSKIRIFRK